MPKKPKGNKHQVMGKKTHGQQDLSEWQTFIDGKKPRDG